MLSYDPSFYDAEEPTYCFTTQSYQFILYAGDEIARVVEALPQVWRVFPSADHTIWVVTLHSVLASNPIEASAVQERILDAIDAFLPPPLSRQWAVFLNSLGVQL